MRSVALVALCVACWSDKGVPTTTVENREVAPRDLTGAYWCKITNGDYTYDPYPCVIKKVDQHFVLAKLGGSQRFTGVVEPVHNGFTIDGEFYCPWGDCTVRMHGRFVARSGALEFHDHDLRVVMTPAPDDAFGGVTYGGDGYGGFSGWTLHDTQDRDGRHNPPP